MNKKVKAVIAIILVTLAMSACTQGRNKAANKEAKIARAQLGTYLDSQPIPVFKTSQLRKNLIEIETAQANATVTTSFFFNQGVPNPITSCPSIGFPIPASYQLSNPQARVQEHDVTLPQLEANGVYTGDSTGTYAICINPDGDGYAQYWEGYVATVAGPATWDPATGQIVLTGAPSAEFSTGG